MTEEQASAECLAEEPELDDERRLTRRQFLRGGLAGGTAGLAMAAGTGVAVWKIVDDQLQRERAAREVAEAEVARLQRLVNLYEALEKVGLDAIVQTGMVAVALSLEGVDLGAKALKSGLDLIEGALLSLEEALPRAREAILWLEARVSALADGVEKLETALGKALEKATDNPIAEALSDFADVILDNLPFGLGDKMRRVLDGLVDLVTSVDDLIEGVNTRLLEPLREWFSGEDGEGIGATLMEPLVEQILDPLEAHLEGLATLADAWQRKLMAPAQQALEQRAKIRENIARYKEEHGLE